MENQKIYFSVMSSHSQALSCCIFELSQIQCKLKCMIFLIWRERESSIARQPKNNKKATILPRHKNFAVPVRECTKQSHYVRNRFHNGTPIYTRVQVAARSIFKCHLVAKKKDLDIPNSVPRKRNENYRTNSTIVLWIMGL